MVSASSISFSSGCGGVKWLDETNKAKEFFLGYKVGAKE